MKRTLTVIAITIVCIFGLYTYLTWGNNGNPRFMHHRYNKVVTEPLAKLGIADAQYKMGLFYIVGATNPPSFKYDAKADLEKAIYWWEKASAKGNEKASEELAKARELLYKLNYRLSETSIWDEIRSQPENRNAVQEDDNEFYRRWLNHVYTYDWFWEHEEENVQAKSVIQFDTISARCGFQFENGHSLRWAYGFIYPIGESVQETKIREQLIKTFFEYEGTESVSVEVAESHLKKTIVNEILSQIPMEKDGLFSYNYDKRYSATRIVNNKVLVYAIQSYWYRGGAHGLEGCDIENYDLQTGKKIMVDDLFSKSNQPAILELIKPYCLYENEAWVSENFMILPKEIKFWFNPYQVAAYSDGRIGATVKFSEFKHLLKPSAQQYFYE